MNKHWKIFALATTLATTVSLATMTTAFGHHAFSAEFDSNQPVELTGVITKFALTNPHSWLYLDVKDKDGKVTAWGFEFGTPFALQQKGITKKVLSAGQTVTIKGFRSKSGEAFGYATYTVLANGQTFSTGGAPDAPAAPAAAAN